MSELPNKKELEEAAEKYGKWWHGRYPKGMTVAHYCNEEVPSFCFEEGAHYQHPVSYAQGIRDVIKFLRIGDWHGLCDQIESLFSAQLKTLETGNDEQRSGE